MSRHALQKCHTSLNIVIFNVSLYCALRALLRELLYRIFKYRASESFLTGTYCMYRVYVKCINIIYL